jgi:hypothetical protein
VERWRNDRVHPMVVEPHLTTLPQGTDLRYLAQRPAPDDLWYRQYCCEFNWKQVTSPALTLHFSGVLTIRPLSTRRRPNTCSDIFQQIWTKGSRFPAFAHGLLSMRFTTMYSFPGTAGLTAQIRAALSQLTITRWHGLVKLKHQ